MTLMRLNQIATYWKPGVIDANGDPTWDAGVKVVTRWANQDGIVAGEDGSEQKTEYAIYTTVDIPKRAMIALGDYDGMATPVDGARKVVSTYSSPSISNLHEYLA